MQPIAETPVAEAPPLMPPVPPPDITPGFGYVELPAGSVDGGAAGSILRMGVEGVGDGSLSWPQGVSEQPQAQAQTDMLGHWTGRGEFGGASA